MCEYLGISFCGSNTFFSLLGSEFQLVPQSGIPPLNEITPRLKQTIRLLFSFRTVSWGPPNSKISPQTSQLTNPSGSAAQQRILGVPCLRIPPWPPLAPKRYGSLPHNLEECKVSFGRQWSPGRSPTGGSRREIGRASCRERVCYVV